MCVRRVLRAKLLPGSCVHVGLVDASYLSASGVGAVGSCGQGRRAVVCLGFEPPSVGQLFDWLTAPRLNHFKTALTDRGNEP